MNVFELFFVLKGFCADWIQSNFGGGYEKGDFIDN